MARGSRDYFQDIYRASVVNKYQLRATETLLIFGLVMSDDSSLYAFYRAALGSGSVAHGINSATGLATPYTVAQGYNFTIIMVSHSLTQNGKIQILLDTQPYVDIYTKAPIVYYENPPATFEMTMIDPTLASSHTFDITLTNLGAVDMYGEGFVFAILDEGGTPPRSKVKLAKCKWCKHEDTIKADVLRWKCPKCEKETWFLYRGLR